MVGRVVSTPTFAVVIPTHNRHERLLRCLEAIGAQERPPDEVVVVDDGSQPAVELPPDIDPQRVHVVRNDPPLGAAAARNRGWRATSTDYVLFTDDDCRPAPGWVAAMAAAARRDTILVGRTLPDPDDGEELTPFDRSVRIEACDGGFLTCNILYPRDALETVGGFDERFRLLGEDTDLGQRVLRTGRHGHYVPEALVHHAVTRDSLRGRLRERSRITDIARLSAVHPQLRRQLWLGRFVSRDHRLLVAGLAAAPLGWSAARGAARPGVTAARRAVAGAVAALALLPSGRYVYWLGRRSDHLARDRPVANALSWFALDLIEIGFLARGSLEHRTLLL
jgi:GT2 family glycosyltransferase